MRRRYSRRGAISRLGGGTCRAPPTIYRPVISWSRSGGLVAGRDHVLFATDEILPDVLNYLHARTHVPAVRTKTQKLVTYTHWFPGTTRPVPRSLKLEFYDYTTAEGRAETRSHPHDPRSKALASKLFSRYVPTQMQAPLPT